jgi:pimeloyl-ACP methyl ester carboxylesterase
MRKPSFQLIAIAAVGLLAAHGAFADKSAPEAHVYEVRGAKLYTETLGHGPPIVFLHGGMQFFDNAFALQRDVFAADHTVIGIDQRSHGHSPDGDWSLTYQGMADDTAAVLKQMKLGPVDIVGHSDGGNVALLLARDHPELVRRMVISGANIRSEVSAEELERRHHWSAEALAPKLKALSDSMPPDFRTEYERVTPEAAGHWMVLVQKSYFLWMTPVVIPAADLKKVLAPTLVMAGDHDFTSIEETVEIYRGLARGQLIIAPGTGHGTLNQRPKLMNLAIREFFDSTDPGKP